jgi:6-phosphofructokinase 1
MENQMPDFEIQRLGECLRPSPMRAAAFVPDSRRVLYHTQLADLEDCLSRGLPIPAMEAAGPRERIHFDPASLACGIVTCGGLCPGLNDVIRAIVLSLHHHYGVTRIHGFKYGYEGLVQRVGHVPMDLTPELVNNIQNQGGTLLGSSRGNQNPAEMVDTLERMGIGILFTAGGDGTQRGASALCAEIARRGLDIAVIGIPKTIDNDISYIDRSFGFNTAAEEARRSISAAHSEASGARNGVGLVKLMGRESGFIAAYAALSESEVNFCIIPEIPFSLEVFLEVLQRRIEKRGHAVIAVAEGAGQELFQDTGAHDASGNAVQGDIGILLRDAIKKHFKKVGMELNLKYIDPSYIIRSLPAEPNDAAFCLVLGHNAVHAGMTGRTNMVVGHWNGEFTHVPISLAVSKRKKVDPKGWAWNAVVSATGQPEFVRNGGNRP